MAVRNLVHQESGRRDFGDNALRAHDKLARTLGRRDGLDGDGPGSPIIERAKHAVAGIVGHEPAAAKASVSPHIKDGIEPIIALCPARRGARPGDRGPRCGDRQRCGARAAGA